MVIFHSFVNVYQRVYNSGLWKICYTREQICFFILIKHYMMIADMTLLSKLSNIFNIYNNIIWIKHYLIPFDDWAVEQWRQKTTFRSYGLIITVHDWWGDYCFYLGDYPIYNLLVFSREWMGMGEWDDCW